MLNLELLAVREIGVNGMSVCLKPKVPVVITPGLVNEIRQLQNSLAEKYLSNTLSESFYVVWFLEDRRNMVFHGLDFNFIVQCLKNDKIANFERYIAGIFDLIFLNRIGLGFPVINCSIVSRALSGISKEFFFNNKICFIHKPNAAGIEKIAFLNEYTNCLMQKEIYEKNHYFYFDSMRIDKMRNIMEEIEYEVPSNEEINHLKSQFELLKNETIHTIYQIASRNLQVLERMAKNDFKLCPTETLPLFSSTQSAKTSQD